MNNFKFENKTIFILSPENWGKMMLSKHHYAIELAKLGNSVYFITLNLSIKGITISKTEYNNLFLVNYSPFFPYKIKFHSRFLFERLMKFQIKRILNKVNKHVDIVWCFDFQNYPNLKYFKAKKSIFHPVDPVVETFHISPAKTADIIFSVSEKILSSFNKISKPKFFINHGLNNTFAKSAKDYIPKNNYKHKKKIKIGYFGNLLRNDIEHQILKRIILENKNVEFHFWGPLLFKQSNIGGSNSKKVNSFINFLKETENVFFNGILYKEDLINAIKDIDIFILIYRLAKTSDRSNAHKLIEYLATGKAIVSNQFSTYKKYKDLIIMPFDDDDKQIPKLFKETVNNIEYYNSVELQKKRIEFALDNTYEKQIERIEKIISEVL